MSDADLVHRGGCFCGSVRYQVVGKPILRAYCHCSLCQRLNAAAFILTVHFPSSSFRWAHPEPHADALDSYSVSTKPWKVRWRCRKCGSTVATNNTKANKWSVYGAQFDRDDAGKTTRMVDVQDELGKWTGYENESTRLG
ncbi:Mss4-like protein [Gymnopilus junonius]|uniref:Mss4-like protein n=1 Tax=Gymnopilus junonius TaxID=109634 RepID=A0A9P5P3V8_GYMJU|nr:Mss4-like protein [Gymnopilus junonius]